MNSLSIASFFAVFQFLRSYSTWIAIILLIVHLSNGKRIGATKLAILLMIPLIIAFAFIPVNYEWWWSDCIVYAMGFQRATTLQFAGNEIVFALFKYVIRLFTDSTVFFFGITSSIYTLLYVLVCKRMTKGKATLSLLTLCFGGPFFIAYLDNTLRAGMALSIVLLAFTFLRQSRIKAGILAVAAIGIHTSMLLPVGALTLAYYYPKPRVYYAFWFLSIIVSLVAGSTFSHLFANMMDDQRMSEYLMQDADIAALRYNVGFRWDFILYSLLPLVVGWYFIVKKNFKDKMYLTLYSAYIIANIFWILVIRAPFSDRFAYLSWFMIPFLYGYPLLNEYRIVKKPILWYCGFLAISLSIKIMM
jgi:hypothetical protein